MFNQRRPGRPRVRSWATGEPSTDDKRHAGSDQPAGENR